MYAIVDIETTGGSPQREKITEIAIFIHNGEQIIEEYTTLVNPEKYISPHITALTGITNEMVCEAPKFFEIAKRIVEITENKIFVAHNVNFDYSFIKNEFKQLGYNFQKDRLCTIKLSRKLIPGLKSYSLGNLCQELKIKVKNRHRAAGDAMATVKIFELLMDFNRSFNVDLFNPKGFESKNLHPNLAEQKIKELPEETGLYYFYNDDNEIIYIGKSKNIKARVFSHLNNDKSKKSLELKKNIADISYELTGSELIALLKESDQIKKYKPIYNRAQRRTMSHYGLYYFKDNNDYLNFKILQTNKNHKENLLTSFNNKKEAIEFLNKKLQKYQLCLKLCGLYSTTGACFHYEILECLGACVGKESAEEYNQRAIEMVKSLRLGFDNVILIDKGRHNDEHSFIKIEKGKYLGFGYLDNDISISHPMDFNEFLVDYEDNREVQIILKSYLRKNNVMNKIIY